VVTERKVNGQFRRILVAYDGSRGSEKAFQVGLSIAETLDSQLEILAVIRPGEPATSVEGVKDLEPARKHYELALRKLAESADGNGRRIETKITVGHPANEIVKRAEQNHSDLVVVGHRGTSAFQDLDMGSVSEHVLASAPCAVLVTR
jgi:nucleotide-binding universal stress UspA family protein